MHASGAGDSDGTPVAVDLDGVLAVEVRAYVETELGWQVVQREGALRPRLALVTRPVPGVPCVVLHEGPATVDDVRSALQGGALDVLAWPGDRARLRDLVRRAPGEPTRGPSASILVIGGAAGGVGTSTVALAAAGVLAWAGASVLGVGADGMLRLAGQPAWRGPGALEVAGLDPVAAGAEVAALSRPVPAVPGLRLLGGGPVREVGSWPADVVVVDAGTASPAHVDLLCARPDAHLAAAADLPSPVLLVGDGPLDARAAARVLGRRPLGRVVSSSRVARAGVAGRVPDGLPGRWLADLRSALAGL